MSQINSSGSYCLAGDVSGTFFIDKLDPGSEYLYNILVYNGNELAIVEINKTFFTNNRDLWINGFSISLSFITDIPLPTTTEFINNTKLTIATNSLLPTG